MTTTLENGATLPVGLTMTATPTAHNSFMEGDGVKWPVRMDHWRCVLRYQGREMRVTFSKGEGHGGTPPTAAEVVECLAQDVAGVEGGDFTDWAVEVGYDTDSRKAARIYKAIRRQRLALLRLLGDDYTPTVFPELYP